MDLKSKSDEFYNKLHSQLAETSKWPSQYLYKFIVTNDQIKVKAIEDCFVDVKFQIETKTSKNGNYISVSIKGIMKDPDQVIEKYKLVGNNVDGVISL